MDTVLNRFEQASIRADLTGQILSLGEIIADVPPAKAKIVTATKEVVDGLLSLNTDNRQVRPSVLKVYKREIESGEYVLTNQGIGVDVDNVLTDGQHRLIAIKECGYPPVPLLIVTGLCKKAREKVDQHAKRSSRDMFLMFTESREFANTAPAVCRLLLRDESGWNYNPTFTEIYEKYEQLSEEVAEVLSMPNNGKFYSAAHLAAFVWYLGHKPEKRDRIMEMYTLAMEGEGILKSDPAYHLRSCCQRGRGLRGGSIVQEDRFIKTLNALSAHVRGKPMGALRATDPR